ncbi:LAFA_0D12046g1_1 [Lachancea sp. 'fantastica']|nr:LAFA_0D12046g1_1 [Lachancea sp. 'fantastica']
MFVFIMGYTTTFLIFFLLSGDLMLCFFDCFVLFFFLSPFGSRLFPSSFALTSVCCSPPQLPVPKTRAQVVSDELIIVYIVFGSEHTSDVVQLRKKKRMPVSWSVLNFDHTMVSLLDAGDCIKVPETSHRDNKKKKQSMSTANIKANMNLKKKGFTAFTA